MKRFFLICLLIGGGIGIALFPRLSLAQNSDLEKKIKEYEQKLTEIRQQKNTLASQIQEMDTQIYLKTLTIQRTEQKITETQNEIDTLTTRIDGLDSSLTNLSKLLIQRVVEGYKRKSPTFFDLFFDSKNVGQLLNSIKYQRTTQDNNQKLLLQVQEAKSNYEEQKSLRETKKKELDQLIINLESQKAQLKNQQEAKRNLLAVTQNSEGVYQQLLEKAKQELGGYSAFTRSAGGGLTTFGNGSNGWYYTQRDPQWGNLTIGNSPYPVWQAGCALTSVAMVCKNYGQNITPADMALDTSKFIYGDLINNQFNCAGKTQVWIGGSRDEIKSLVKENVPVILRLNSPSVSGLHFVVGWKWDDGKDDLIIHDPYFGPDIAFTSQYNWYQVTRGIGIR